MEDAHLLPTERRLAALVRAIDTSIDQLPPADLDEVTEHLHAVNDLLDAIASHEVDREAFIEHHLVPHLARTIVFNCVMPLVIAKADPDAANGFSDVGDRPEISEWTELLEVDPEDPANTFQRISQVIHSLSLMDFQDALQWARPTGLSGLGVTTQADPRVRWLSDRFSATYLQNWAYESLLLEWKYLHGQCEGVAAPRSMLERRVNSEELGLAIAGLVSESREERSDSVSPAAHVEKALEMLQEGRYSGASAIFESLAALSPLDSQAHNNWGFCLIPFDPEGALKRLEYAADIGMASTPVNVCNRMLCLSRLSRPSSALSLAERYWQARTSNDPPEQAWLWDEDANTSGLELQSISNCDSHVARLAERIALKAGDPQLATHWASRHATTSAGPHD
jgi:hypothetical protein